MKLKFLLLAAILMMVASTVTVLVMQSNAHRQDATEASCRPPSATTIRLSSSTPARLFGRTRKKAEAPMDSLQNEPRFTPVNGNGATRGIDAKAV